VLAFIVQAGKLPEGERGTDYISILIALVLICISI
jgi:hypothetical protein